MLEVLMSTPRTPPIPPNKGGELDKSSPTEQHRKVERVEKVSEVDDESRARKFRQYVEAPEEKPEPDLPTPLSVMSKNESQPAAAIKSPSASRKRSSLPPQPHTPTPQTSLYTAPPPQPYTPQAKTPTQTGLPTPSPAYSPPPSTYLSGTTSQNIEEEPPLPQSQLFWGSVQEPTDSSQTPRQPQMEETPRSSSRVFLTKQETVDQDSQSSSSEETESAESAPAENTLGKDKTKGKKEGKGALFEKSPFGPSSPFEIPGKPMIGAKEAGPFARTKEEELLLSNEKKEESGFFPTSSLQETEENAFLLSREGVEKRHFGPEGVLTPKGEEGLKYIGPLAHAKEKDSANLGGSVSKEEKNGAEYKGPIPLEKGERLEQSRFLKEEEKEKKPFSTERHEGALRKEKRAGKHEGKLGEPALRQEEWGGEKGKKKSHAEDMSSLQITSPTINALPEFVIPAATAATVAAQPYLGPEALSMYFHIIGTITAMVSPKGDSRTEFVLNAPSFANSKFYGSTISIERFATAPYQLNIQLTGTNEAINAFNQNIPHLYAAFQNGNFAFTINRIEAAYEKPLFRRKDPSREKGEKEGDRNMGDRNQ